jgi:uncharacterized RDD family membrane protein YckC
MQLVVPREPGVASLPRRAAAGAIDAAIGIAAVGAGVALVISTAKLLERLGRDTAWGESSRVPEWKLWDGPIRGAFTGLAVTGRNWRSPGMRIVGVRRVDARTRGPVSADNAIVGAAFATATELISRALNRPMWDRYEARRAAVAEEVERIRASQPDAEKQALMEASLEAQQRLGVGCGWVVSRMVGQAVAVRLPALWSGRRQTLAERLAGTVIVDDR